MTDSMDAADSVVQLANTKLIHYNKPSRWNWVSTRRPHYNLWISLSGFARMVVEGRRYEVKPGFAILLTPRQSVEATNTGEEMVHNIGLHFYVRGEPEPELKQALGQPGQIRHLALVQEITRYLEELWESDSRGFAREKDFLARQVIRIFLRDRRIGPEEPTDRRIREQAERLKIHPGQDRPIPELAKDVSLSLSQYERRFRKILLMSPNAFIIHQRVEAARSLLRESSLTVDEIARSLGYRDIAYFSRQFKAKTGEAPLAFRRGGG